MPLFNSKKEKQYWLFAALVLFAILATLAFGRPLQKMLRDQNIQAVFFLLGMFLVAASVLAHGLKVRPAKREIALWIGPRSSVCNVHLPPGSTRTKPFN